MTNIKISEVLSFLDEKEIKYEFKGSPQEEIIGFSSLKNYKRDTITWIKSPKELAGTDTSYIHFVVTEINSGILASNILEVGNSKEVFFKILEHFFKEKTLFEISSNSVIETESVAKNVAIGQYCYIGKNVIIEENVRIGNNVSIECPCHIGTGTVIGSGVIIGTDGFGYYSDVNNLHYRVPHLGGVQIGRNVDIGANTCIDRGTIDDTIIDDGAKIDNLCHIAHNVHIGKNVYVIALSMLGGSSVVEENGYIAPGVMVKNQKIVHKNAFVGMGTVVLKDVPENKVVIGVPAKILRDNLGEK